MYKSMKNSSDRYRSELFFLCKKYLDLLCMTHYTFKLE